MVSAEVKDLSATKILAALLRGGRRQLTVYANSVATAVQGSCMVLAVPNPGSVRLLDMSGYSTIFDDCLAMTQRYSESYGSRGGTLSYDSAPLAVHSVGDYDASIVPALADFARLDPASFTMAPEFLQFMDRTYAGTAMGFIVCKLQRSSSLKPYAPFGYVHDVSDHVFVPTMHFHIREGGVQSAGSGDNMADDWSHRVLLYNVGDVADCSALLEVAEKVDATDYDRLDSAGNPGRRKVSKYCWHGRLNKINASKLPAEIIGDWDSELRSFEIFQINGVHPNQDFVLPFTEQRARAAAAASASSCVIC
jgi:hypothetical protein